MASAICSAVEAHKSQLLNIIQRDMDLKLWMTIETLDWTGDLHQPGTAGCNRTLQVPGTSVTDLPPSTGCSMIDSLSVRVVDAPNATGYDGVAYSSNANGLLHGLTKVPSGSQSDNSNSHFDSQAGTLDLDRETLEAIDDRYVVDVIIGQARTGRDTCPDPQETQARHDLAALLIPLLPVTPIDEPTGD